MGARRRERDGAERKFDDRVGASTLTIEKSPDGTSA
jgi:hypothetical protein